MHILRSDQSATHGADDFQVRRVRPGAFGDPHVDAAFGPLAAFDHAKLASGKVVKMHEHKNDEILSYIWRGTMVHEDSTGQRIPLSPSKLMMMNAGRSFWHEESVPNEPVEMLQIFVRPRHADMPAMVDFYDRLGGPPTNDWGLIAGPEGSGAPLVIRNEVRVYDLHLRQGRSVEVPVLATSTPLLYIMDGTVGIGDLRLGGGDAVSDDTLPSIEAMSDASLVLFLVDLRSSGSKAGTISGHPK